MKTSSLTFIEDIHLNGDIFFWKTNVNLAVVLIMENIKLFWLISTRNVTERKWIDLLLYQDAIRLDKNKWSLTLAIGYPTNENCSSFYSYSISRSVEFHSGTYDQRIIDFSTFQPSIRIDRRSTWQACLLFFPLSLDGMRLNFSQYNHHVGKLPFVTQTHSPYWLSSQELQWLFVNLLRVDYHRCFSFCQKRFTQLIEKTTNQLIPRRYFGINSCIYPTRLIIQFNQRRFNMQWSRSLV